MRCILALLLTIGLAATLIRAPKTPMVLDAAQEVGEVVHAGADSLAESLAELDLQRTRSHSPPPEVPDVGTSEIDIEDYPQGIRTRIRTAKTKPEGSTRAQRFRLVAKRLIKKYQLRWRRTGDSRGTRQGNVEGHRRSDETSQVGLHAFADLQEDQRALGLGGGEASRARRWSGDFGQFGLEQRSPSFESMVKGGSGDVAYDDTATSKHRSG